MNWPFILSHYSFKLIRLYIIKIRKICNDFHWKIGLLWGICSIVIGIIMAVFVDLLRVFMSKKEFTWVDIIDSTGKKNTTLHAKYAYFTVYESYIVVLCWWTFWIQHYFDLGKTYVTSVQISMETNQLVSGSMFNEYNNVNFF